MLDFSFTQEQEILRRNLQEFTEKEIMPKYLERARKDTIDPEILKGLRDLGIVGLGIPEEWGGAGDIDCVTRGIMCEELAKGDMMAVFPVLLGGMIGKMIAEYATDEVKKKWLPGLAKGEYLIGMGLTEPGCGTDAVAIATTAVRSGDEYILNGEKTSLSLSYAPAFVIFAKTKPEAGARGVSGFLVPADLPGISRPVFTDLGCKPLGRGGLVMKDVHVPASNLIGPENMGFALIMGEFDLSRTEIGLFCLGCAEEALKKAIDYARVRTAFGHPIGWYEGISFPIAEYHTLLEAAKLLCYRALWKRDQGLPHTVDAAMAKLMSVKTAFDTIHFAINVHGHYGYTDQYDVGQRLMDVMGFEQGDGSAEALKIVLVRELLGKEYLPYR